MGLDYEMQLTMSGVLNICQLVACLYSLWAMDHHGRRKLLLAGGIGVFLCHLIIAVLVGKFDGKWDSNQSASWASVSFLLIFMLAFGASWGPVPWAMPAEIFPTSLRAKGCAYGTMSIWLNNFIIGLITPPLVQNTGYGAFVFFAAFSALSLVWVYFCVPETSGRTLEQMDLVFKDRSTQAEKDRKAAIEADLLRQVTSSAVFERPA